jgi:uncharacterized membrane protein YwzB
MKFDTLISYIIIFISATYNNERTERFSNVFIKKMHRHKNTVLFFLVAILLKSCIGQQTANQGANAKTRQVLKYITDLPKQGIEKRRISLTYL